MNYQVYQMLLQLMIVQKKIGKIIYSQDSSQLGLACAGGTVVRSWTATDTCGNSTTESQIITVTPAPQPEFDTPQDYKISCEDLANFQPTSLSYSNGITTGACAVNGEVVGVAEPFEGSCGSFVVNFTYTDECDYTITSSLTVTVEDLTAPEISGGNNLKVECDGSGNVEALEAWLTSNGGATASDACSDVVWSNNFDGLSDDCGATGSATVTFTATDDCGNYSETTATFTIEDTVNPFIDQAASNIKVECDGQGNVEALEAWLLSNGGALSSDTCGSVSWSNDFDGLSDECGATGTALVVFTAADECGNTSKTSASFTIIDTTNPTIDVEANDLTVECDGQGNVEALEAWLASHGGASASDLCGGVEWSNNFDGLSDDCGATGSAMVTFTATDDCGNYSETTATFTIEDTTLPVLIGQLPQGESNVNACFDNIPQSLSEEEMAAFTMKLVEMWLSLKYLHH